MRLKVATTVLLALASLPLSAGLLLAKPTRTLARPAPRRLIVSQSVTHASRDRTSREVTPHSTLLAHSRAHASPAERAATTPSVSRAARGNRSRPRTLAQERALAAQAAIAAADRGGRNETRTARARHADRSVEIATRASTRRNSAHRPSDTDGDEQASALAAADPTSRSDARALININGVLRPAPGTPPGSSLKSIEEEAVTPVLLPKLRVSSLYDSRGHLIVPPPLYGSHEILLRQNEMAEREGLDRVQDDADLLDLRRQKKLVALPDNETVHVDDRLPENRRFSRPWTAAFLTIIAADFYASFHAPLQVDSAVRTVAVQQRLLRTNGNAAPTTGDTASPHLTGQAVDIAKGGLSRTQIAWMRTYLQPLIDLGKIDVEEEFQQSCFHISVYKNFLPTALPRVSINARQPLPAAAPERPVE
jgi:hypothetical protein